jgi:hypothetical protein
LRPDALPAGHAAVGLERRLHLRELLDRRVAAHVLVGVEDDRALAGLDLDRDDLRREAPLGDRLSRRAAGSSTASASCISRVMPSRAATFSAVRPMWIAWNGSCRMPSM